MSVDASVVQRAGRPVTDEFTEFVNLTLGPSRSYVIQAKGEIFCREAETTVRLTALGFDSDEVRFTMGTFPPPFQNGGFGAFALTVAFTAPDDEEFATAAIVEAAKRGFASIVARVRLLVLTVDSLSFLPSL